MTFHVHMMMIAFFRYTIPLFLLFTQYLKQVLVLTLLLHLNKKEGKDDDYIQNLFKTGMSSNSKINTTFTKIDIRIEK